MCLVEFWKTFEILVDDVVAGTSANLEVSKEAGCAREDEGENGGARGGCSCGVDWVHVGRTWWDDRGDESAFTSVGGHTAPGDAVVVAGGRVVPVGVEAVVGGSVAGRLVLGDGFCACGKSFQVGGRPVLVVEHRFVRLFVQRS